MNQARLIPGKTGLLVSVRSIDEALTAQQSNCVSVIDVKEPASGSLGCVPLETAKAIADALSKDTLKSIALGEVVDWPSWPTWQFDTKKIEQLLSRFSFAKVGLSRLGSVQNWQGQWEQCLSRLPDGVQRVAVAYADAALAESPSMEAVIAAAPGVGCTILLVDTFNKENGNLFDILSVEDLKHTIRSARNSGLKVVLAGSLCDSTIAKAVLLEPDLVAVRGAVCESDRKSVSYTHLTLPTNREV